MRFVLTRPLTGSPAVNDVTGPGAIVPASNTLVVDGCACTYLSVKWFVTLYNQTEGVVTTFEVLAQHTFQTVPEHQRSNRLGSNIDFDTDVAIESGAFVLKITNNEIYDINVSVAQVRTTPITG